MPTPSNTAALVARARLTDAAGQVRAARVSMGLYSGDYFVNLAQFDAAERELNRLAVVAGCVAATVSEGTVDTRRRAAFAVFRELGIDKDTGARHEFTEAATCGATHSVKNLTPGYLEAIQARALLVQAGVVSL